MPEDLDSAVCYSAPREAEESEQAEVYVSHDTIELM